MDALTKLFVNSAIIRQQYNNYNNSWTYAGHFNYNNFWTYANIIPDKYTLKLYTDGIVLSEWVFCIRNISRLCNPSVGKAFMDVLDKSLQITVEFNFGFCVILITYSSWIFSMPANADSCNTESSWFPFKLLKLKTNKIFIGIRYKNTICNSVWY